MVHIFSDYNFILASQSPRRQQLLRDMGISFSVAHINVEEIFPSHLEEQDIALYLCELKANAFDTASLSKNTILITADTIVWAKGKYWGKPQNKQQAIDMLKELSGNTHQVYSGVCLKNNEKTVSFYESTSVTFSALTMQEIEYYTDTYKPYDKAGAYGIQEWIGYIGIEKIEGCYYNVMGFPTHAFYNQLKKFIFAENNLNRI